MSVGRFTETEYETIYLENSAAPLFCHADTLEYIQEVMNFARDTGQKQQLDDQLKFLAEYACWDGQQKGNWENTKCVISRDFAPYSFAFLMYIRTTDGTYKFWFNGGLIYHGAHDRGGDGGAPTFSVNLTPTNGWRVHT